MPAGLPGRWVAAVYGAVRFVKPDFTPGRAVWIPGPGDLRAGSDFQMDVDPFGEWVAWTASDGSSVAMTAFKPVAAPASQPPSYLPREIGWFCSWTDDGNLLMRGGSGFVVVTKAGEVIRQMSFEDYPQGEVTWRRYGRQ